MSVGSGASSNRALITAGVEGGGAFDKFANLSDHSQLDVTKVSTLYNEN